MSHQIDNLVTPRLIIRPFILEDIQSVHQILDLELKDSNFGTEGSLTMKERERWLLWTILNYEQLSKLNQPPYGERAIIMKNSQKLIGICGFVPCLDCFEQLCDFDQSIPHIFQSHSTTEFGLFYALEKCFQRNGYATEAASAMAAYAFQKLHVKRIVATTAFDNPASISVMHHLGMKIKKNSLSTPPWLQIVGILSNPSNSEKL